VLLSLIGYVVVYTLIFGFGMRYIYKLLRDGTRAEVAAAAGATAKRPTTLAEAAGPPREAGRGDAR
jgi:cytochrome d ubiquinol oxidase subunit I